MRFCAEPSAMDGSSPKTMLSYAAKFTILKRSPCISFRPKPRWCRPCKVLRICQLKELFGNCMKEISYAHGEGIRPGCPIKTGGLHGTQLLPASAANHQVSGRNHSSRFRAAMKVDIETSSCICVICNIIRTFKHRYDCYHSIWCKLRCVTREDGLTLPESPTPPCAGGSLWECAHLASLGLMLLQSVLLLWQPHRRLLLPAT